MIRSINIENLCTIESLSIDLSNKKFVVLVGNSGSGKTSITGAIIAALYSSFPDKPDVSLYGDVINPDKPAKIIIEMDFLGDIYKIDRTIDAKEQKSLTYIYKGTELVVGPQAAGVKNWIESNLMNKNTFLSLYYLSQKEKNDICSLNPSAGMSVLLEIFGLDKISANATKYSSLVKSQLTAINSLQNECSKVREATAKIITLEGDKKRYTSLLDKNKKLLTTTEKKRKALSVKDIENKQNIINTLQKDKLKNEFEKSALEKSILTINSGISNLDKAGCKTNDGFKFPKCPLLNIESLLQDRETSLKRIAELDIELLEISSKITAQGKLNKEDSELLEAEKDIKNLNNEMMQISKTLGQLDSEIKLNKEIKSKEDSVTKEIQELQTKMKYSEFLKGAYSKEGIPALIIDAAIPKINEIANKICNDYYAPFKFSISSIKEQKSGSSIDQLNIMLTDENGKLRHISSFSGGEMQLAQVVLRFAIQDFLKESFGITPFDVFIGDEIWSAMDSNLREIVFKLIMERENFEQVILVTHNHDSHFEFDCLVEVEKGNGFTKINVS